MYLKHKKNDEGRRKGSIHRQNRKARHNFPNTTPKLNYYSYSSILHILFCNHIIITHTHTQCLKRNHANLKTFLLRSPPSQTLPPSKPRRFIAAACYLVRGEYGAARDHSLRLVAVRSRSEDRGAEAAADKGAPGAADHRGHLHAADAAGAQRRRVLHGLGCRERGSGVQRENAGACEVEGGAREGEGVFPRGG